MLAETKACLRNGLLLTYRKEHGLSQKQAAEECGVHYSSWTALERLDFGGIVALLKIARYLGVEPEEIAPKDLQRKTPGKPRTLYRHQKWLEFAVAEQNNRLYLPSPIDVVEEKEDRKVLLAKLLKTLSFREREVIKLRYGIGDGYTYTLKEVSRIFKVTRERVRQVEAKAIRKLQHLAVASMLKGFADKDTEEKM